MVDAGWFWSVLLSGDQSSSNPVIRIRYTSRFRKTSPACLFMVDVLVFNKAVDLVPGRIIHVHHIP